MSLFSEYVQLFYSKYFEGEGLLIKNGFLVTYFSVPNRHARTIISSKVCRLSSIYVKRQTLPEINVHARLFSTLE